MNHARSCRSFRALAALGVIASIGCGSGGSSATSDAYDLSCSFFHRSIAASQDFTTKPISLTSGQAANQAFEVGDAIPISLELVPRSDGALLTISFPRAKVTHQYELPRIRPTHDHQGNQGFSGRQDIVTPGSNTELQYICEPHAPTPRNQLPAEQEGRKPPVLPTNIECTVTANGSAGQQTQIIKVPTDLTSNAGPNERETQRDRHLTFGNVAAHIGFEPPFGDSEGRTLILHLGATSQGPITVLTGWTAQQLLHLPERGPISNNLLGPGALSGTSKLRVDNPTAGTSDEVSIACASKE